MAERIGRVSSAWFADIVKTEKGDLLGTLVSRPERRA